MKTNVIIILSFLSIFLILRIIHLEIKPKLKKVHLMESFTIGWHRGYQRGLLDNLKYDSTEMVKIHDLFIIDSLDLEISINKIK